MYSNPEDINCGSERYLVTTTEDDKNYYSCKIDTCLDENNFYPE